MELSVDDLSIDDLAIVIEQGQVVLLDVRHPDRFLAGHIPGSLTVPLRTLPERIRDADDPLWSKLQGASTSASIAVVADDGTETAASVAMLAEVGLPAVVVRGGVLAWSRAGRPLNRGLL